jgi:hypothetical protein
LGAVVVVVASEVVEVLVAVVDGLDASSVSSSPVLTRTSTANTTTTIAASTPRIRGQRFGGRSGSYGCVDMARF